LIPSIEFGVSRAVNEFCHLSVLYRELMPAELTTGMLANKTYETRNSHLRHDEVRLQLQRLRPFQSESEWYEFATGLMKRSTSGGLEALSEKSEIVDLFQDIRRRRDFGFEQIWRETRPRLEAYREKFASEWSPISDQVLTRLSSLAKSPWRKDRIRVHFIDCLYGGFGWKDCIGFAPFPDMEVQKKFIAHELSELITPQHIVVESLRRADLNPGIAHTVVDLLAYFSVRDFLGKPVFPNPEKRGIRPNQNYYPAAEELYPVFERYAENPSLYQGFSDLVEDMVATLKEVSIIQ
jgi:hypothetical protein